MGGKIAIAVAVLALLPTPAMATPLLTMAQAHRIALRFGYHERANESVAIDAHCHRRHGARDQAACSLGFSSDGERDEFYIVVRKLAHGYEVQFHPSMFLNDKPWRTR